MMDIKPVFIAEYRKTYINSGQFLCSWWLKEHQIFIVSSTRLIKKETTKSIKWRHVSNFHGRFNRGSIIGSFISELTPSYIYVNACPNLCTMVLSKKEFWWINHNFEHFIIFDIFVFDHNFSFNRRRRTKKNLNHLIIHFTVHNDKWRLFYFSFFWCLLLPSFSLFFLLLWLLLRLRINFSSQFFFLL